MLSMVPKPFFSHGLLQQYPWLFKFDVVNSQLIFFSFRRQAHGVFDEYGIAENVGFNFLDLTKYVYYHILYLH